jgi:hypothetical protein
VFLLRCVSCCVSCCVPSCVSSCVSRCVLSCVSSCVSRCVFNCVSRFVSRYIFLPLRCATVALRFLYVDMLCCVSVAFRWVCVCLCVPLAFRLRLRFAFLLRFCCVSVALRSPSVVWPLRCAAVMLRCRCVAFPVALSFFCVAFPVAFRGIPVAFPEPCCATQRNGDATQWKRNAMQAQRNGKATQGERNAACNISLRWRLFRAHLQFADGRQTANAVVTNDFRSSLAPIASPPLSASPRSI